MPLPIEDASPNKDGQRWVHGTLVGIGTTGGASPTLADGDPHSRRENGLISPT